MAQQPNRRDFVKTSAALSTAFWVGNSAASSGATRFQSEKLNVACIGCEGKGGSDSSNAGNEGTNVVALCDIDEARLNKKHKQFSSAEKFVDYREMLDKIADKIDVVTVSTPDHSHCPASIMAMKKGKHVYCQKPLTWSIYEARRMREVAAEMGVVTQMGNQGTSENGLREAVEVLKSGGIGTVKEVHVWTNRPVWPQGKGRPEQVDKVPDSLHWDLFLGPAPERPYHGNKMYTPFNWRGWLDFGTGALGDMACHTANMVVMGLDLFEPASFEAVVNTGLVDNEQYPARSKIRFEFPARGKFPATTMYWYDGGELPSEDILPTSLMPEGLQKRIAKVGRPKAMSSGSLVIGDKGMLFSPNDYGAKYYLLPEDKFQEYKVPEPWLPRIAKSAGTDQRHMHEFISACRGEGKTMSNFGYAGRLTETILCGNLALRVPGKLEWDAKNLTVVNNNAARQFIHREYREGWSI